MILNGIFIAAHVPRKGEVDERLKGSVKNIIKKATGKKLMSRTELDILINNTTRTIKNRPITQVMIGSTHVLRFIDFIIPQFTGNIEEETELQEHRRSKYSMID